MSLINLSMKHGRTLVEAKGAMEHAVQDIQNRYSRMIRRADWDADRNKVRIEGTGFWVEMKVDASEVHASGDIPILGGLLGGSVGSGIKQIVQHAFAAKLPGRTSP